MSIMSLLVPNESVLSVWLPSGHAQCISVSNEISKKPADT